MFQTCKMFVDKFTKPLCANITIHGKVLLTFSLIKVKCVHICRHCNEEMPAAGFSSEEDNEKRLESEQMFVRLKHRKSFDKAKDNTSHEGTFAVFHK